MKRGEKAAWVLTFVFGACVIAWSLRTRRTVETDPTTGDAPAARAPSPPARRRVVEGTVVDGTDGRPVARASVVVVGGPKSDRTMLATDTAGDGTFTVDLAHGGMPEGAALELRVRAPGRAAWRGAVEESAAAVVRLARLDHDPVPGRIACTALDLEGRPVSGEIGVRGFDEFFVRIRRAALADDRGAFVLEGVPPGTWSLALTDEGPWTDVVVDEDRVSRTELRSRAPAAPAASRRELAAIDADIAASSQRIASALAEATDLTTAPERRRTLLAAVGDEQRRRDALDHERVLAAAHRPLVVTGIPATARTWVAIPGTRATGSWRPSPTVRATAGTPAPPSRRPRPPASRPWPSAPSAWRSAPSAPRRTASSCTWLRATAPRWSRCRGGDRGTGVGVQGPHERPRPSARRVRRQRGEGHPRGEVPGPRLRARLGLPGKPDPVEVTAAAARAGRGHPSAFHARRRAESPAKA